MSGGYNHISDCTCPWCLHLKDGWSKDDLATPINFCKAERATYTIPNARCPECFAPVFFYRSPNGGGVYFDELGIPWQKHPCTDHGRQPLRNKQTPFLSPPPKEPDCQKYGWFPIVFENLGSPNSEGIQTLWIKNVLTGISTRWQTSKMPIAVKDGPAFAKLNAEKRWDIDTPSGKYVAWNYPVNLSNLSAMPLWRKRLYQRVGSPKSRGDKTTQ